MHFKTAKRFITYVPNLFVQMKVMVEVQDQTITKIKENSMLNLEEM